MEDEEKLIFSFEFVKNKFSELIDKETIISPKYTVGSIAWYLSCKKHVNEKLVPNKTFLAVHLHLEGEGGSKLWCCYAQVSLSIISQKEGVNNFTCDFQHLFSSVSNSRGYLEFMEWDKLEDPQCGYTKDDAVHFRVYIVADSPQNVDPNYQETEEEPQELDDWLSLFETNINEKIVCRISAEFKNMSSSLEKVSSVADEVKNVLLKNSCILSEVKNALLKHSSVLDEVKNAVLKNYESNSNRDAEKDGNGKIDSDEKNYIQNSMTKKEDSILKILGEFKNDMKKEFFSLLSPNPLSWYGHEHFSRPHYELKSEADLRNYGGCNFAYCEPASQNKFKYLMRKKSGKKGGCISSSSSYVGQRKMEKDDANNDSDSTSDSYLLVDKPRQTYIPSEEEALRKNFDLNLPWKKQFLLIGKDVDGKLETHKATCLKELYDLKRKFPNLEVLVVDNVEM